MKILWLLLLLTGCAAKKHEVKVFAVPECTRLKEPCEIKNEKLIDCKVVLSCTKIEKEKPMSNNKAKLATPFTSCKHEPTEMKGPGRYGSHNLPVVGKPADYGKDDVPVKFFEEIEGHPGSPATLETPMSGTAAIDTRFSGGKK